MADIILSILGGATLIASFVTAYMIHKYFDSLIKKRKEKEKAMQPNQSDMAVVEEEMKLQEKLEVCEKCLNKKKFDEAAEHYKVIKEIYDKLPKKLKGEFHSDTKRLYQMIINKDSGIEE